MLFRSLDDGSIAGALDDAAMMHGDYRINQIAADRPEPRKRKVFIRAIKNIEPGEEINYDYGTDYFKAYLKPIGCKCGACEKKRKKKRAEARVERAREREKAERKARRLAEKLAKAKEKLRQLGGAPKKRANGKANGKTLNGKALNGKAHDSKGLNRKALNGKANGKYANGHDQVAA